ncbi:hypothetical protein GCM10009560_58910 [Nonomuraea longicatena]|uniref:Uncharacterized protein n=1 Tax=Nonomuraea longicatena TaxID=83682 RepID=A0ABP4B6F5_9ACTN
MLKERAGAVAPHNPKRVRQVRARVRRRRTVRALAAGVAVAGLATAGWLAFPGTPEAAKPVDRVAVTPGSPAPETFTSRDGTAYRRVALQSVDYPGEKAVTLTIPLNGKPLDLAAFCESPGTGGPMVRIEAKRFYSSAPGNCAPTMRLTGLDLPERAKEVKIVIDPRVGGWACVGKRKPSDCTPEARQPAPEPREVSLAFYEWTPPERPVDPGTVPEPPAEFDGYRKVGVKSGVWPGKRSVTFEVEGHGGTVAVDAICSGELAGRLRIARAFNGRGGSEGGCAIAGKDRFGGVMTEFPAPRGKRVRVTLTLRAEGETTNRPVGWRIGLYRK